MILLLGRPVAKAIKEDCKLKVIDFQLKYHRLPQLAVILVGDNPSSQSYVKGKRKACDYVGILHKDIFLEKDTTEVQLLDMIEDLNKDKKVDGILVQLPLPPQINEKRINETIVPEKDVDGFNPVNVGSLLLGRKALSPCTPRGILKMLDYYGITTEGKNICIVGRSNLVGKPMASMLIQNDRNATVTICHSHTKNLKDYTSKADILIIAVGKPSMFKKEMLKQNAVVIDVGITMVNDSSDKKGYVWKGDVDFEDVKEKCFAITPVPKGVGPMTIAVLMQNTLDAAFNREEIK